MGHPRWGCPGSVPELLPVRPECLSLPDRLVLGRVVLLLPSSLWPGSNPPPLSPSRLVQHSRNSSPVRVHGQRHGLVGSPFYAAIQADSAVSFHTLTPAGPMGAVQAGRSARYCPLRCTQEDVWAMVCHHSEF